MKPPSYFLVFRRGKGKIPLSLLGLIISPSLDKKDGQGILLGANTIEACPWTPYVLISYLL